MFRSLNYLNGGLFDDFRRLEREMEQLFGAGPWPSGIRSVARGTYPPINIGSTPEQVDVYLFAAGLNTESLDISIQKNLLTIDGQRRLITEEGASYFRRERFDDAFHRVVTLPDDVDPDKVEASYVDGVLRITIQRRETTKPRQIEIK
ncbi:MAG: Hsp20/alpha crystallin family protein [Gammaproteobacteria bacterium]|nr:Hsp20/alpha crystallin family protein [Gammaproteobacteria bacterium]MCB1881924.1 Hsp20/alpha crystallin family protein [Gammaproteobacteria bacterium]